MDWWQIFKCLLTRLCTYLFLEGTLLQLIYQIMPKHPGIHWFWLWWSPPVIWIKLFLDVFFLGQLWMIDNATCCFSKKYIKFVHDSKFCSSPKVLNQRFTKGNAFFSTSGMYFFGWMKLLDWLFFDTLVFICLSVWIIA